MTEADKKTDQLINTPSDPCKDIIVSPTHPRTKGHTCSCRKYNTDGIKGSTVFGYLSAHERDVQSVPDLPFVVNALCEKYSSRHFARARDRLNDWKESAKFRESLHPDSHPIEQDMITLLTCGRQEEATGLYIDSPKWHHDGHGQGKGGGWQMT